MLTERPSKNGSMSTVRPRVLLADDYPGMLNALGRLLPPECDAVGRVEDGCALIEAAGRLQPDVIVLDLNMPNLNGLDACKQVLQADPGAKIIMLTAMIDDVVRQKA